MKKFIVFCLMLACTTVLVQGQTDSVARALPTKRSIFVMPKVEVVGGALALAYGPARLMGGLPRQLWPAWVPISVEVGICKRISLIGGIAGRLETYNSHRPAWSPEYQRGRLLGAKFSLAMRYYLKSANGQGFYLQPTAKLVWQSYYHADRESFASGANRDFIFSTRFGWQKHLVKGLHLDVAVGPGIGVRNDFTHDYYGFAYYHSVGMGEIDNERIELVGGIGRNWTSINLIGDASFALGWKF